MPAGRPLKNFIPAEEDVWGPRVFELAKLKLSLSSIAGAFGLPGTAISPRPDVLRYVQEGWSYHDQLISRLLMEQATAEPREYEQEERAQIRALKADAIKTLHKVITRELPVSPQEAERVKRLSDEELKAELDKVLAGMNTRNKNYG